MRMTDVRMFESLEDRRLLSATLTPTQRADVNKLYTDLQAVEAKSGVTQTQVLNLVADVKSSLKRAHLPSHKSIKRLVKDTKSAYADKTITLTEGMKLLADAKNVMSTAGVSGKMQNKIIGDATTIVVASNFNATDVKIIFNDLVAIADTV
jgi:hypothetical protein